MISSLRSSTTFFKLDNCESENPCFLATDTVGSNQNFASPSEEPACTCGRFSSREKKKNRYPFHVKTVGLMSPYYASSPVFSSFLYSAEGMWSGSLGDRVGRLHFRRFNPVIQLVLVLSPRQFEDEDDDEDDSLRIKSI
jgi:hypothetical protein